MNSSYNNNIDYSDLLKCITFIKQPTKIVEFGLLEGFSLQTFLDHSSNDCMIEGYDIFDDFIGNKANYDHITNLFKDDQNVSIYKRDFYTSYEQFKDNSIDILHIDIANTGAVYQFVFDHYIQKITQNGIIILEGGSEKRDHYEWMITYNKPKIKPVIEKYREHYNIITIGKFPSITLVQHK
jgi:predicted O-methyltransferase YrrM|tara:strand:- start:1718 stop:2263 length:546 start_codon:yes stop_codon:yes gene_type:complete